LPADTNDRATPVLRSGMFQRRIAVMAGGQFAGEVAALAQLLRQIAINARPLVRRRRKSVE
jgi:hypothetical protein